MNNVYYYYLGIFETKRVLSVASRRKTTFYFVSHNIMKNVGNLKYMGFVMPCNTLLK